MWKISLNLISRLGLDAIATRWLSANLGEPVCVVPHFYGRPANELPLLVATTGQDIRLSRQLPFGPDESSPYGKVLASGSVMPPGARAEMRSAHGAQQR